MDNSRLPSGWVILQVVVAAAAALGGCASPTNAGAGSCMQGAPCMTSNPGVCESGHISCSSGMAVCMPDVTERSCYSGLPPTMNKGACRAGTQSCIGGLGPCVGEVLPKHEDCLNDIDDDCDGIVNNGCPIGLALGAADPLALRGGTGGTAVPSRCPSGSVVTGIDVLLSDTSMNPGYIVSVQPTCATPTLARATSGYYVTLAPAASPPAIAGSDKARSGTSRVTCAGGGFSAAYGTLGSVMSGDRTVVESVGLNCGIFTLALGSDNQLQFNVTRDDANSGSAAVQIKGTVWNDTCGPNEVLIGFDGRAGAQIDQLQGICAPLAVTYK